ncbi:uncharacterized protein TA15850 [Theileria annulata]|uniref:TRUD domain-containing protein n=1 Tax=Theileria annulata TaxID=5874 RepID=Q4UFQ3_THEAN|nr:uncharacterized protein TA15850 [Theileria annulata]CAI74063.1 hypothetical protein, conserved [Theileria annulata]|eukprot:XP_951795.1 hypothetical protein, conserved [Theileria annulata]
MATKSISVGIEKTISDCVPKVKSKRVNGFVKFLLEDFHVHEIDLEGKILNLGQFVNIAQIEQAFERKKRTETGQQFLSTYKENSSVNYPDDLFQDLDKVRFDALLRSLSNKLQLQTKNNEAHFALLCCKNKEDMKKIRTRVHQWIRTELPFLESTTVDLKSCKEDEKMSEYLESYSDFSTLQPDYNLIIVEPTKLCKKFLTTKVNENCVEPFLGPESQLTLDEIVKKVDKTDYETFKPKSYARYLHFNMLKINRETSEVVNMICKSAKRSSFDIFSAGNKDKRGITVQRMCIRRCKIVDLFEAMTKGWFNDVYLSDFLYKNKRISLGDLTGNHFKIVIRGIEDQSNIHKCMETLKTYGFINYFGLQRFGTKKVGTHIVGAALIHQKYDLAIRLILGDIETAKQYKVFNKFFKDSEPEKVDNCESTSIKPENLEGEMEGRKYRWATDYYLIDNDPETALKNLPSHLFIEKSILKGIISKIPSDKCLGRVPKNILSIYVHSTQSLLFNLAASERLDKFGYKVVAGDLVATGEQELSESSESEENEPNLSKNKRIQILEVENEEEAKRYTIEQVVLPLPGDNVKYPRNIEEFYRKIAMENFNISLDDFSSFKDVEGKKHRSLVSVRGSYRFLIVKPKDISYEVIENLEDPFQVLIKPEIEGYMQYLENYETQKNSENIFKLGDLIRNKSALLLRCSLPKSSYITVALREIITDQSIENNYI